jgi:hypothetical protein
MARPAGPAIGSAILAACAQVAMAGSLNEQLDLCHSYVHIIFDCGQYGLPLTQCFIYSI